MSYRLQKINHAIRNEISDLFQRHVKDPRLGSFIAITDVQTSPDLKFTRVYVSFMGSEEDKKQAMTALSRACGFFRRELAVKLRLRTIPEISFHWDDSIERGNRVLCLIDQVESEEKAADKQPRP